MAKPKVQSLARILSDLEPAYAGSRNLYNTQIGQVAGQTEAAKAGLGVAKDNAFRDINTGANSKGLAFSGIPIGEQARYTGEKYLPALAGLDQKAVGATNNLQLALAALEADKYKTGLGTRERQQTTLDRYLAEERSRQAQINLQRMKQEFEQGENERNRGFTASQNAASRSSSNASIPKLSRNSRGGWEVSAGYDLAGYARATGADLIELLSQGDSQDRQAAQWYKEKINKYGTADAAKYFEELKRDRPTAFYRGG